MYYLEVEHTDGNLYRISWNGSATTTYKFQLGVNG